MSIIAAAVAGASARVRVQVGGGEPVTPHWIANHEGASPLAPYDSIATSGTTDHGVQTDVVWRGTQSAFGTITGAAGVRFTKFLNDPAEGADFYYSVWMHLPEAVTVSGSFWNVFQWKARPGQGQSPDPAAAIRLDNNGPGGALKPHLEWNRDFFFPGQGDVAYQQTLVTTPIGQWFHFEAFLHQAADLTGRIIVWQDGVQIFDVQDIQTKYPGADTETFNSQTWAFNNYSNGLTPSPYTMYFDDAVIASERVWGKTVVGL